MGAAEFIELRHPIDHGLGLLGRQRLEVGEEVVGPGQVGLGLPVEAAVDGVIGPLEQAVFAVDRELETGGLRAWPEMASWQAGTTTEAVMSSSICTFTPAAKSWRSLKVRQPCEDSRPTRR